MKSHARHINDKLGVERRTQAVARTWGCCAGAPPHVPGVLAQGFQRRRSRALPTTLTLEKAIAAPATIGLSRPKAASGMPITL